MRTSGGSVQVIAQAGALRDDAAQLRLIADNLPAMSIAYDETLHCVFANRRFAEFFGLTPASIVGKHLREIIGESPYREIKSHFERVLAGERATYSRTRILDTGELRHLEVELIPHIGQEGRVRGLFAITLDVTERRREEQLRRLGYSVTNLIAEADRSAAAIQAVIRAICETERWECGRYLQPGAEGAPMRVAQVWGIDDATIQRYLERSREFEHVRGEGLIGQVWQSGQALWVEDLASDARALRRGFTPELGLRGGFVFPVKSKGEVIGVLAFNSRESRTPDEPLLQAILSIGSQIGQFLERKRAEEQLRESEARFRSLTQLSSDWYWQQDAQMQFVATQGASDARGGITPEAHIGKCRWDLPHTEIVNQTWDEHRALLAARKPFRNLMLRRRDSEGEAHFVAVAGEPVFDAHGVFRGYHGVATDVTAHVLAEEQLRQSEERFRSLTELSSDWYWELDTGFRIAFISSALGEKTGLDTSAYTGSHPWDQPALNLTESDWARFRATLEAHQAFHDFEIERPTSAGRSVWLAITGGPVFDVQGTFTGYRGVGRDLTERKHAEQRLRMEHSVTRCLAGAESVHAGITGVLQAICEAEAWECGRYFSIDEIAQTMQVVHAWHVDSADLRDFVALTRGLCFSRGTGLVGRVWESGAPLWAPDLRTDPRVLDSNTFQKHPTLRSDFQFPVLAQGRTIGVISVASRATREPDQGLMDAVRAIGSQVGQFVARKAAEAQRHLAEQGIRESEARFRSLCALSSDVFWEQDAQYRFTAVSDASGKLDPAEVLGKTRWEQHYTNMSEQDWANHKAVLDAHRPFRDVELCRMHASGKESWYSVSGEPVFDGSGAFAGYRGVGRDITERKIDEQRIRYLASHDSLTGLPNRAQFSDLLNAAKETARRHGRLLAVMFVDLDRFKLINDTLGHEAGDELLRDVGTRLRHTLRASDVIARLGGDEFVVLLQEVKDALQVEAVARKILAALIKPLRVRGQECTVTASIGICFYPADASDEQSLMKKADAAMYRAKDAGKNNFKFYSNATDSNSVERLAMETSLRRGLERNEFFLHYQPRIDLKSGTVTGAEALVRWQHPELGAVPPAQFIPLAEETGIIVQIGTWVLGEACAQAVAWQEQGLPALGIAVNLSARQFADEALVNQIAAALESSGLAPALLELELTESVVAQNVERAATVLAQIKELGVRLAIDDFGTGYSSLAQLKRFPIDTLKIDRSFVTGLPHGEDAAIALAIIGLGRSLDLVIVAEGVETPEQQAFLREHACHEMQGFLVSRPLSAAQYELFLRDRS